MSPCPVYERYRSPMIQACQLGMWLFRLCDIKSVAFPFHFLSKQGTNVTTGAIGVVFKTFLCLLQEIKPWLNKHLPRFVKGLRWHYLHLIVFFLGGWMSNLTSRDQNFYSHWHPFPYINMHCHHTLKSAYVRTNNTHVKTRATCQI